MYYMLECHGVMVDQASIGNLPDLGTVSWISGRPITEEIVEPIRVDLDTSTGEVLLPMLEFGIPLLRKDMIEALRRAGVDNLQCFDAVIHDRARGIEHANYSAVNIVGLVACADLSASDYIEHGEPVIDTDFESLVIDESKTHGLLMFRLAECVTGVVIHEKVKEALERAGIEHLDFVDPEDWVG